MGANRVPPGKIGAEFLPSLIALQRPDKLMTENGTSKDTAADTPANAATPLPADAPEPPRPPCELTDEALDNTVGGATTYTINVVNKSDNTGGFMIFQKPPTGDSWFHNFWSNHLWFKRP